MCWYTLDVCPFPDHDPISTLIFNPAKAEAWVSCDEVKPWGRLSCGCLTVKHPTDGTNSVNGTRTQHVLATQTNRTPEPDQKKHITSTVRPKRSSTETTIVPSRAASGEVDEIPCLWCTAVLKLVSTKSQQIRGDARQSLVELEAVMKASPEWLNVQEEIENKKKDLLELKQQAWNVFVALTNEENSKDEVED